MSFMELLRGATLQGDAATLSSHACTRLGRALGTLIRRRGIGAGSSPPTSLDQALQATAAAGGVAVVIARADDKRTLPIRDGLVRGLILAGHHVKDIGVVGSDIFTFALRHLDAPAGVVVADGDALSIMVFLGGRPLVGEGLQSLVQLADAGELSAGEGSLSLVDVRAQFHAWERAEAAAAANAGPDSEVSS